MLPLPLCRTASHDWHQVFSGALRRRPPVGVLATIRAHVDRHPTRSEVNAGRRAAHSLARGGDAILVKVLASPPPRSGAYADESCDAIPG